jgi:hypothetical protein
MRTSFEPDYFDDDDLADLVAFSANFFDEHPGDLPSKAVLRDNFRGRDQRKLIARLYKEEIGTDVDYTVERMMQFAHSRAMAHAIAQSSDILEAYERGVKPRDEAGQIITDDPLALVQQANMIGRDFYDTGANFHETIDAVASSILHPEQEKRYYTTIQHFDEAGIFLTPGELGVIGGAPKKGKSQHLVNLAYNYLKQGYNVVYYSLELSQKLVMERFWRRLGGPKVDMKKNPKEFVDAVKRRARRLVKGQFVIKSYPTRTASVSTLRAHLMHLVANGFKPDIIIVDYGDIMKPERRMGELRHEQAGCFEDLRGLAGEFQAVCWTATQMNRGSLEKMLVTMADVAESFEKVAICDLFLTICQTQEEKDIQRARLFMAAVRGNDDNGVIEYQYDWSRSLAKTLSFSRSVGEKQRKGKGTAEEIEEAAHAAAQRRRKKTD